MNIKPLVCAFFAIVSLTHGQEVAAKARESVAAALRAPVLVSGAPLTRDDFADGDRATIDMRFKRGSEDWMRFLREKTKAATGPGQDQMRTFEELGYWRVFTDLGTGSELMRTLERRAAAVARLSHALKAAKTQAEMETDAASRGRIITLIDQAAKEVERWQKKPEEANAARGALRAILPQFLKVEGAQ